MQKSAHLFTFTRCPLLSTVTHHLSPNTSRLSLSSLPATVTLTVTVHHHCHRHQQPSLLPITITIYCHCHLSPLLSPSTITFTITVQSHHLSPLSLLLWLSTIPCHGHLLLSLVIGRSHHDGPLPASPIKLDHYLSQDSAKLCTCSCSHTIPTVYFYFLTAQLFNILEIMQWEL